jgi:hypothetical protein
MGDAMETWIGRYAQALGVEPLREDEIALLLDFARDVAHGTERKNAPLATFLAGFRAGRAADGREQATEAAVRDAEALLRDG